MTMEIAPGVVAHAVQLAIAPVFLLTGLAGLLAVMANRLARVIDRARWLAEHWPQMSDAAIKAQMIARGYVAEGYGPDAVAMCAPLDF